MVVRSSALESDRVEAIVAGPSAYIRKPLALHQFRNDLESILRRWMPDVLDTFLKVSIPISVSMQKLTDYFKHPHCCDVSINVPFLEQS